MSLTRPDPIDLLQLSTDSRIPPEVYAAVRKMMPQPPKAMPDPAHCRLRVRRWRGPALAERMAQAIAARVRLGARCVTQADLLLEGFSPADIAAQGDAAVARAAELLGHGPAAA